MTNATNRLVAQAHLDTLDAAHPDGWGWIESAARLAKKLAPISHDWGRLDAALSSKGQLSRDYAEGVGAYIWELAQSGRHDKALAKACQKAGVLPPAEDRKGIVNGGFNLAERAVQWVRNPRARQSNGRQF